MVQEIEDFGTELQTESFRELRVLVNREVPLLKARTTQRVTSFVPEVPRSRLSNPVRYP